MTRYRLTFSILVSVIVAALFLAAGEARAASTTLEDEPSCTTLGGTWNSVTLTCNLSGTLTLGPLDSLNIVSGVTLINDGTITSSGAITNDGTITNGLTGTITTSGSLTNTGIMNNSGTVTNDPTGTVDNSGTILNNIKGIITSSGSIDNSGTIDNCGLITVSGFAVVNSGTINNSETGTITDSIGITNTGDVTNQGVFTESGTVTNSGGEFINFAGTFTNTGTFNTGTFFVCGGIVTGIDPSIVSTDCLGLPVPDIHCSMLNLEPNPIPDAAYLLVNPDSIELNEDTQVKLCAGSEELHVLDAVITNPVGDSFFDVFAEITIPSNFCHIWEVNEDFQDLVIDMRGTYFVSVDTDDTEFGSEFQVPIFVIPESAVGAIALVGSSLAALAGYVYFRQYRKNAAL